MVDRDHARAVAKRNAHKYMWKVAQKEREYDAATEDRPVFEGQR